MNSGPVLYAAASAAMLGMAWATQRIAWARRLKVANFGNARRGMTAVRTWLTVLALALLLNVIVRGYIISPVLTMALAGQLAALFLAVIRKPLADSADSSWKSEPVPGAPASPLDAFGPAFVDIMIAAACGWTVLTVLLNVAGATV